MVPALYAGCLLYTKGKYVPVLVLYVNFRILVADVHGIPVGKLVLRNVPRVVLHKMAQMVEDGEFPVHKIMEQILVAIIPYIHHALVYLTGIVGIDIKTTTELGTDKLGKFSSVTHCLFHLCGCVFKARDNACYAFKLQWLEKIVEMHDKHPLAAFVKPFEGIDIETFIV